MDRLLEIDLVKGIAVILMMTFHVFYLPKYMGLDISSDALILKIIARISQFIFITLVGVNMVISYQRNKKKNKDNKDNNNKDNKSYGDLYKNSNTFKQISRAAYIFVTGMCISLVTYLLFDDWYVKFGILHFIGISILLLFKFVDNNYVLIPANILVLVLWGLKTIGGGGGLGLYRYFSWVPERLAFITGLYNTSFKAMDHFPIVPWIAVMINGILIGKLMYTKSERNYPILKKINDKVEENKPLQIIAKIGQYSFRIYLVHYVVIYLMWRAYKEIKSDPLPTGIPSIY
jgi:uncharacterized membrane protein